MSRLRSVERHSTLLTRTERVRHQLKVTPSLRKVPDVKTVIVSTDTAAASSSWTPQKRFCADATCTLFVAPVARVHLSEGTAWKVMPALLNGPCRL